VSESTPEAFAALLTELAPEFSLALADGDVHGLAAFLSELTSWNRTTNLFGRLTPVELARHALESAAGSVFLEPGDRIVDIGSGGGFPGIPLAISGHYVILLEPRERRAAFLRHLLRKTIPGLKASVLVDRVEKLSPLGFDAATVRAVGRLGGLIGRGDFLKEEGKLVIWTTDPEGQAAALGAAFRWERESPIPGSFRRKIALFRKCSTGNVDQSHG